MPSIPALEPASQPAHTPYPMASQPRPDGTARLMLFFAVVYAVEGIGQAKSGIVWQPLTHFLKEAQGWGPVQISVSLAVLDVPWVIKPLYGLVSDFLPLAGYRRRSYLLLASLAACGRVRLGWDDHDAGRDRSGSGGDRRRHGGREHGLRRTAGGERSTARAPAMRSSISNGCGSTWPPSWPRWRAGC